VTVDRRRTAPRLPPLDDTPSPGALLVVCGIDGSGKTTLIEGLADHLRGRGLTVTTTRQPTPSMRETEVFRLARVGGGPLEEYRALYLCTIGDRLHHCNTFIRPRLARGEVVVSDRYIYTTFANMVARGHEFEPWVYDICRHLPLPDIALWTVTPPDTALERIRARPNDDCPDEPLLRRLHHAFALLAAQGATEPVDAAAGEPRMTLSQALDLIRPCLARKGF